MSSTSVNPSSRAASVFNFCSIRASVDADVRRRRYRPEGDPALAGHGTSDAAPQGRSEVLLQIVAQFLRTAGVSELRKRLGFDLADALTRDAELASHLFEGAGVAVDQSEPELDNLLLA